jgi:hypothetical protein
MTRKKPVMKNRVPEQVEQAIIALAIENPALGNSCVHHRNWPRKV